MTAKETLRKHFNGVDNTEWAENAMKEFAKQALELAKDRVNNEYWDDLKPSDLTRMNRIFENLSGELE